MRISSLVIVIALLLSGCASVRTVFKPSPHTASSYTDAELEGGSLAIVMQQDGLPIEGSAADSFDLDGVLGGIDAFEPFFLNSFGDSLLSYGSFSSVEIQQEGVPIPVRQGTYRTSSTKYELFDIPAEHDSTGTEGNRADFVMLIKKLGVGANEATWNADPAMGMGPPTAWTSIDYVLWHNDNSEVVSYGRFSDYIVADSEFEDPELWRKLAGHLAWLTVRKTPFATPQVNE